MGSPDRVLDHRRATVAPPAATVAPQVEIVVPVHNEERDLAPSVRRLHAYLRDRFPFTARITIADNASTDATWAIALALAGQLDGVRAVSLDQPGRGRALRSVWSASDAEVLAYMDVDLSTDLNALLPLVAPLLSGHSDVAIGTRLAPGARVSRGPRREVISRCYNLLLHATLRVGFSDAQCGFKAIRADRARPLLARTEDPGWFFDTELLVLAERAGLRIHEVPVDWTDDTDSRVNVVATALADLRGIARLGGGRQLSRFLGVGVVCTAAYVLLYLALRTPPEPMSPRPAPAGLVQPNGSSR
jgi:glycosyltransferase involved in cell wall biosynthesis